MLRQSELKATPDGFQMERGEGRKRDSKKDGL